MLPEQWCTPTNISGIFIRAFMFFRYLFPVIIRITLFILVPVQLISLAASFMAESAGALSLAGWTIILIASFGGQLWITASLILFTLTFCISESILTPVETLKRGTRFVTPLLSLYLIIFLFIMGISLLISMLMIFFTGTPTTEVATTIQIFALFMAFFILYPRFFLAQFIVIDETARVGDAMRKSPQLFNVNRGKVLAVFLVFVLLNIFSLLLNFVTPVLSFISMLFFVPFSIFIQTFLYLDLKIECGEFVLQKPGAPKSDELPPNA